MTKDPNNDGFSPLPRYYIAAKLSDMELHDDLPDSFDQGYMAAVNELKDWLDQGAPYPDRTPESTPVASDTLGTTA
jgi:hypothetical protein